MDEKKIDRRQVVRGTVAAAVAPLISSSADYNLQSGYWRPATVDEISREAAKISVDSVSYEPGHHWVWVDS